MGKFLDTEYSQIQNKIIRKSFFHKPERNRSCSEEITSKKVKRKIPIFEQGPDNKKARKDIFLSGECNSLSVSDGNSASVQIDVNSKTVIPFLKSTEEDDDLFADDEIKASCHQYTKFNFLFIVFDEISLEGLDGITLEALWKRLTFAFKFPVHLYQLSSCIWRLICANENIKFYKLPEPREDLLLLKRTDRINDAGEVFAKSDKISNIYKGHPSPKVLGSCTTLRSRIDISDEVRSLDLNNALNFKNELVIVADQKLRINALYGDLSDLNYEITAMEYCLLEKIGRARQIGEITQGDTPLGLDFNLDSKSVHHYKNRMIKQNFIAEQFYVLRTSTDQCQMGKLLQLSRFYVRKKSKYLVMTETVVDYLKKCRGYKAEFSTFKKVFGDVINSKLYKSPEFSKFIDTKVSFPYKEFHPFASKHACTGKNLKEKIVKTVCLKNPYVNVIANWYDNTVDTESLSDEENEANISAVDRTMNLEYFRELFLFIKSKGFDGSCMTEILSAVDVDVALAKLALKTLTVKKVLEIKRIDVGKQRINQYIATCLKRSVETEVLDEPNVLKSCGILERLKQNAKRKIDSLSIARVYTADQFEPDQNVLNLTESLFFVGHINVPRVTIKYLILGRKFPSLIDLGIPEISENSIYPICPDKQVAPLKNQQNNASTSTDQYWQPAIENCILVDNFSPNYPTKAFLLAIYLGDTQIKAVLQYIDIDDNRRNSLKRKRSEDSENNDIKLADLKIKKRDQSLNYMGPNPMIESTEEKGNGLIVEIIRSTPSKNCITGDITIGSFVRSNFSERVFNRRRIVLSKINSCKVFKDCRQMLKIINEKENQEGVSTTIDLKSLHRLLRTLVIEGYIKIYQAIISDDNFKKIQVFICHPEIVFSDKLIQDTVDDIILKSAISERRNLEAIVSQQHKKPAISEKNQTITPLIDDDIRRSINELRNLTEDKKMLLKLKQYRGIHLQYGYRPKFARMSILHEILFYLIYVLNNNTASLSINDARKLFSENKIEVTEEDLNKLPLIYSREISWKMFIPPLPIHPSWEVGWALMCDIILRIPITLIANLHSINYMSTELQEILRHPIKRFYLLKDLSPRLRCLIMLQRRYIHHMYSNVVNLCYCGLIQFGPQKCHDKDQSFLYFNRRATLYDTSTSEATYLKTTIKNYNKLSFEFTRMSDIQKYWFTMHNICMNTTLFYPKPFKKSTVILEKPCNKAELIESLVWRQQNEVKQFDNGSIPGDGRGAAGMDSALFSHLKKSWFNIGSEPTFKDNLDELRLDCSGSKPTQYEQLQLPLSSKKFFLYKSANAIGKSSKNTTSSSKQIIKHKKPKRNAIEKAINKYYDSIDRTIVKKFRNSLRLKPIWTDEEDKIIILLKLASIILSPKGKTNVGYFTMRDVLHRVSSVSQDKTSKSIPRRCKILLREFPVYTNIDIWLTNLLKFQQIYEYFLPLRTYIMQEKDGLGQPFKLKDREYQVAFLFLCQLIFSHREEIEIAIVGNLARIDYFCEANIDRYKENVVPFEENNFKYYDPVNEKDIRKLMLKNMIQSTVSNPKPCPEYSYKLYQLYQKSNDGLLEIVLSEMKETHLISIKKSLLKKSFIPYVLSFAYVTSHSAMFSYHTVNEAYGTLLELRTPSEAEPFKLKPANDGNYGQLLAFNEIATLFSEVIDINIWIPEQSFVLNSCTKHNNELIDELAKRYRVKLITEKIENKQLEESRSVIDEQMAKGHQDIYSDKLDNLIDDYEPIDLSNNLITINNLKNWISNCIDTETVRSPSPELLIINDTDVKNGYRNKSIIEIMDADLTGGEDYKADYATYTIPPLDQIKEEMLKISLDADKQLRLVPYITDLPKLLTENFTEVHTSEQRIDDLKQHFVQQYPILKEFRLNNTASSYIKEKPNIKNIWKRILNDVKITPPSDLEDIYREIIDRFKGTINDMSLINNVLDYISEKGVLGATGPELQQKFSHMIALDGYFMEKLLNAFLDNNVLLRSGVTNLRFIHYKYQSDWLLETVTLHENRKNVSLDDLNKSQFGFGNSRHSSGIIKIKPVPWITIDSTINMELFKLWLSNVLSYCIQHPGLWLHKLFKKFHSVTPVDLFYLIEVLDGIGCIEIRRFQYSGVTDIFAKYEEMQDSKGSFLDNFDEIFINSKNLAFVLLGEFLNNT